uniref:Putative homing endonuclease n=1 Tax=viral metagenome TaxID=1070528 RepID=A0A6H1ZVV2_9ZZZZ
MNDLTTAGTIKEKTCSKCGETKPAKMFGRHFRCLGCESEANKKYRQDHKEGISTRRKANYLNNIEQIKERWEKYSHGNRDKINAHQKRYRLENSEKIKEQGKKRRDADPEKSRAQCREWAKQNPEKMRRHWADTGKRKRALLKGVKVEIFKAHEIYERDGWICQLCHKKVNKKLRFPNPLSRSLDHIIPLSLGGTHERKNVQLTHYKCNVEIKTGGIKQTRLIG